MLAYCSVALVSCSPTVLAVAVASHSIAKLVKVMVEKPHRRKRYGDQLI